MIKKYFTNVLFANRRDKRFVSVDPRAVAFIGWDCKTEELLIEHKNGVQSIHRRIYRIDTRESSIAPPPVYVDPIEPDVEVLKK